MHKKQYDNWIHVHIISVSILKIILSCCIMRFFKDQFTFVVIFENRNHRNIHETLNYSCGCTYSHKYFAGLWLRNKQNLKLKTYNSPSGIFSGLQTVFPNQIWEVLLQKKSDPPDKVYPGLQVNRTLGKGPVISMFVTG